MVKNFYRPSSINPLFSEQPNDNRPYLKIVIMSEPVTALFDSGANNTIIGTVGRDLLRKLNIPIISDNSCRVTTADGQPQDIVGYADLPITLNNVTHSLRTLIVPSVKYNFILGMDFAKLFKLTADFCDFSWNIPVPITLPCVNSINSIQDISKLGPVQQKQLKEVISLFESIASSKTLGLTSLISHHIEVGDAKPVKQRQYPLSPAMQVHLNKEIDEMLELKVIQPSNSPWSSPLWLVPKSSGEYRLCFDGRKLNSLTVKDSYPLPLIDGILNKLRDANYLSSIDLRKAFWQIPLTEPSRAKTAFAVHGRGLFEFRVMPFGLSNSPQTMQRLMDQVIGPSLEPFVFVYLDDIIIATPDFDIHLRILREVFDRLKAASLSINLQKCEFCRSSLAYLGFIVDHGGLRTNPDKVSAIVDFPVPQNTTQIKRLIGLVSWYRRFIKDFSSVCSPITDLLHGRKKGQPIKWTSAADEALKEIKQRLISAPVLASPDFAKPFIIQTDASDTGLGAVLYQESDGLDHPVAFASKTLNKCQRKYTVTEKECLAVIFGIEHFRSYIEGTHFQVQTDHYSLLWLHNMKEPVGRLARWAVKLQQYDFDIVHRKGSQNVVADFLSRSVGVLDVSTLKPDVWYGELIRKVTESPDKFPSFRVDNGCLYKHVANKHGIVGNLSEWKLIVPKGNRAEVFRECHDDTTAGHFGISKTFARISELYYWPRLRQEVYRYVRKCEICQAQKSPNQARPGLMGSYKNINFPFQLISMDLLGPLPRSRNGNQFLLVVVDWFTKFVLVQPLARATSKPIIRFVENHVFLVHGVPQIIVVDNGSQFISRDFQSLATTYKVQKIWYNARYHPQINHTERINRIIVTALSSYIHDNHRTWDENVFRVAQAIRLSKHEVTGFSPAFLAFGRNVPLTGDFYGKISDNADNVISIGEKNQRLEDLEELPRLYVEVRNDLFKAYKRNVKQYNLRKRPLRFRIGDKVWKKNFTQSNAANYFSAKLAPKYVPCVVNRVISNLVYQLKDLDGADLGNWHIKDLKPDLNDQDVVEDATD